jgi:hypothetical protein
VKAHVGKEFSVDHHKKVLKEVLKMETAFKMLMNKSLRRQIAPGVISEVIRTTK